MRFDPAYPRSISDTHRDRAGSLDVDRVRRCPICQPLIDRMHECALAIDYALTMRAVVRDPDGTNPPIMDFDLVEEVSSADSADA